MRFQDLAEEPLKGPRCEDAVGGLATNLEQEAAAKGSLPTGPPEVKWFVIESRLLNDEQVLVVLKKEYLRAARKAHPGKVIYFPPEVEELYRDKDAPDFDQYLKAVHLVKKELGGWVIPLDEQMAKRPNRACGKDCSPVHGVS